MPSTKSTKNRINVVCVILTDKNGRIFAAKRPDGKPLSGKWEFPGGKIESDETAKSALKREIREELGVEILVEKPLPVSVYCYDFGTVVLHPFYGKIVLGHIDLLEHPEGKWLAHTELDSMDWAPADLPIVKFLSADE